MGDETPTTLGERLQEVKNNEELHKLLPQLVKEGIIRTQEDAVAIMCRLADVDFLDAWGEPIPPSARSPWEQQAYAKLKVDPQVMYLQAKVYGDWVRSGSPEYKERGKAWLKMAELLQPPEQE